MIIFTISDGIQKEHILTYSKYLTHIVEIAYMHFPLSMSLSFASK